MATSRNAKLEFESGQTVHDYAVMTDAGDHQVHTISGGTVFSSKSGFAPVIRPNGIVSGRNLLSTHATDDYVTVAAHTVYIGGSLFSVTAGSLEITRPLTAVAKVCSVCIYNNSGTATIVEVEGESGAGTTFSETRGAAGGPPSIPDDYIEIGQVRVTSDTSDTISSDEIFQVVGTHAERFDYPGWTVNPIGDGINAATAAEKNAHIKFDSALPMIHGDTATDPADDYKKVYIRYYSPTFVEAQRAIDFVPVENTHSVTSTQVYGNKTIGSTSSSMGQGSFTAMLSDGVTDALLAEQDQIITVRFYPDKNNDPYILTQGTLGVKRTFPVADQNQAACTITGETVSANFSS
jgi:hypothetical protein